MSKTFVRDYTYQASEVDSKVTARAIALQQVKALLLEEIGIYIESDFKDTNIEKDKKIQQLSKQQIVSITAGITKTKVLEEKWDGESFYIKAAIEVDEKDVKDQLKNISQDRRQVAELEDVKNKVDEVMQEMQKLKEEMEAVKDENEKLKLQQNYREKNSELASLEDISREFRKRLDEMGKMHKIQNRFGLGLGNPYFSVLYKLSNKVLIEPRFASDFSSIYVYTLRGYYNFLKQQNRLGFYSALEISLIDFNTKATWEYWRIYQSYNYRKVSKKGIMGGICVGCAWQISKKFDLNLDIGPYQISLDDNYVSGIEWIINTGIRFWI